MFVQHSKCYKHIYLKRVLRLNRKLEIMQPIEMLNLPQLSEGAIKRMRF